jgi:hypothetical protein
MLHPGDQRFPRGRLGLYQDVAFGEPERFERWNKRDRVESCEC